MDNKVINLNRKTEVTIGDKKISVDFTDKRLLNKILKLMRKYENIEDAINDRVNEVENNEGMSDLDKIIALPVFLAPGIHTNIDIPQLLGLEPLEEDPRCPDGNYPPEHYLSIAPDVDFDGEIELLSSIGPRDELLDIIDKRVE